MIKFGNIRPYARVFSYPFRGVQNPYELFAATV